MTVQLLTPDGSAVTDLPIPDFQAGADSTPVLIDVWYRRGETVGDPVHDLLVGIAVEDPVRPGVGVTQGVPPADQLWGRAQELDPDTDQPMGDEVVLGAYRVLPLGSIPVGGRRRVRLLFHPPSSATAMSWRFYPTVWSAEHSRPLAVPHLGGPGIVTGVGNAARTFLVRGGAVTPSDPADSRLTVGRRQVLIRGGLGGEPSVELTFDRTDGDGIALADLERYRALVVWHPDHGVQVRKGPLDSVDPPAPSLEVGDHLLQQVLVEAPSGGGPPELTEASLEGDGPTYDRFFAEPDPSGGPTLILHRGDALGSGSTWRWWDRRIPVALPTDSTFFLWQTAAGLWTTTTAPEPPTGAAEGPWWRGSTDSGGAVTELVDQRTWCERQAVLQLRATVGAVGEVWATQSVDHARLWIDRVVVWAPDLGGATSGRLVVDVEVDGSTVYPSGATEAVEPRPAVEPGVLRDDGSIPELCELRAGQVIQIRGIELPGDGSPAEVWISLRCLY